MKREDLAKLGLEAATVDQIMALHGSDIESHKAKLTAAEAEREAIKAQLAEAGKTIDGFKGLDIEGVKKTADEWKAKAEAAEAARVAEVAKLRFDTALDKALAEAKAKDTVSVRAHLKADALNLNDDGSIEGLKAQLDTIKTSYDFLFEAAGPTPRLVAGANNQPVITDATVDAARKAAGLTVAGAK